MPVVMQNIDSFNQKILDLFDEWKNTVIKTPWWKIWGQPNLIKGTKFLIESLDQLVNIINEQMIPGEDKKATVLDGMGKVYDFIAAEAMPKLLLPFKGYIKTYLINTLVSTAIDWMVDKYKNGSWRQINEATEVPPTSV